MKKPYIGRPVTIVFETGDKISHLSYGDMHSLALRIGIFWLVFAIAFVVCEIFGTLISIVPITLALIVAFLMSAFVRVEDLSEWLVYRWELLLLYVSYKSENRRPDGFQVAWEETDLRSMAWKSTKRLFEEKFPLDKISFWIKVRIAWIKTRFSFKDSLY